MRSTTSKCPVNTEEEALKFLHIPGSSLIGERVVQIIRLGTAGINQRQLLPQLTAERIASYGALARYIATILTLLGLLGTVLGLSFALLKIQGALAGVTDISALQELAQALRSTLGGMKTAFGNTLAGLGTAVLLSAYNHLVRRTQSRVSTTLESFVAADLLPFLESFDLDADQAARVFVQTMTKAAQDMKAVSADIVTAAKRYSESSEVLTTIPGPLMDLGAQVTQLSTNQQTFVEVASDLRDSVHTLTETAANQLDTLRAFTASFSAANQDQLSTLQDGAKTNREALESLQKLVASFERAIAGYQEKLQDFLGNALEGFKNALNTMLADLSQRPKDELVRALHAILSDHETQLDGIFKVQTSTLTAVSDIITDMNINMGALLNRQEQLVAVQENLEINRRLADAIQQSVTSNQAVVADVRALAQGFQPIMTEHQQQFRSFLNGVLGEFKTTLGELLNPVIEQHNQALLGQVQASQQAYEKSLKQYVTELQTSLKQYSDNLSTIFKTQDTALQAVTDMIVDAQLNMNAGFGQPKETTLGGRR